MQTVGHLYEHNPYVLAHGQEQLAEVLGLGRGLFAEYSAGNLCEAGYDLSYFLAEQALYVLDGVVGVLHHVVEQGGTYRRGAQAYLLTRYLGHSYGMEYVGLA